MRGVYPEVLWKPDVEARAAHACTCDPLSADRREAEREPLGSIHPFFPAPLSATMQRPPREVTWCALC